MENTEQPQGRVNTSTSAAPNPAKYFAEWKSDKKGFEYYDKVNKTRVLIPLPFTFIPLERCISVKGYNEPEQASYSSNELKHDNALKGVFTVRKYDNAIKKSSVFKAGKYEDIKIECKSRSAKWTESIYIAVKGENGKLELANLQLNGSGITHWFDFTKNNNIFAGAVSVKKTTTEKKGKNEYLAPVFEFIKIKPETDIEAAVLQKQILEYLDDYYKKNESGEQLKPEEAPLPSLHQQKQEPKQEAKKEEPIVFNPSVDDDDLPF